MNDEPNTPTLLAWIAVALVRCEHHIQALMDKGVAPRSYWELRTATENLMALRRQVLHPMDQAPNTPTLLAWIDEELEYHNLMMESFQSDQDEAFTEHNIAHLHLTTLRNLLMSRHDHP